MKLKAFLVSLVFLILITPALAQQICCVDINPPHVAYWSESPCEYPFVEAPSGCPEVEEPEYTTVCAQCGGPCEWQPLEEGASLPSGCTYCPPDECGELPEFGITGIAALIAFLIGGGAGYLIGKKKQTQQKEQQ